MFSAIILAGGAGSRMLREVPKQFLALGGKPLIMHTLDRIDKIPSIGEIIIVCHPQYKEHVQINISAYMLQNSYKIIDGGESRQESTYLGLKAASSDDVLIHEAARPFVTKKEFETILSDPGENVIYGVDIPFTVSLIKDGAIDGLLHRDALVNVQLPQKFSRKKLLEAHEKAISDKLLFTEDASILYHYEKSQIKVLQGMQQNVKITSPVDIVTAELIYKEYISGRD
ncbi:MAG: 2-C-methyl-D-erythritol 4-phosphate cytidylyltransferase [Oscillospiraceae bacterium]|nr:2-C-methyl-D-erythritol 4-phosphate cytidylyltransferase [Oscillospiraceae bacterium]